MTLNLINAFTCVYIMHGGLYLDGHEIDGGGRGSNKDNLHRGVVERHKVHKEIKVARDVHKCEQNLTAQGHSCRGKGETRRESERKRECKRCVP